MSSFFENTVNQKFREIYNYLEKNNLIKGKSDIAKHLDTYNHVINSILKGKRNITVDQLNKLVEKYSINANYIFGCSDEMLAGHGDVPAHLLSELGYEGRRNITLVPNKAVAGYAMQRGDSEYLSSLQRFSIPGYAGQMTAFEISGDSMYPTITNGDIVVCEPLERGTPLRDNNVYVVVTDVVVAKRIQQIKTNDRVTQLRLISDNSTMYQPYDIDLEEITQIMKVKCRLTQSGIN